MRIAYLSQSFIPSRMANSVHVMKMCSAFALHDHDVLLNVASRRPFAPHPTSDFEYYGVKPDLFVLRKHWYPKFGLPGRLLYSLLSSTSALFEKDALYYSRHPHGLVLPALLGRTFALEMHAPPTGHLEHQVVTWLLRRVTCKALVVISSQLAKIYHETFPSFPAERILVAHDAADPLPSTPHAHSTSAPLMSGYFGSLLPGRGIDLIMQVAARLREMDFHIFGGSSDEIQRWAEVATTNVYLHGHIPPASVPAEMMRMHILMAPYQQKVTVSSGGDTSAWMSPLKIFEYMAAKRAIVCSDLPVLREILTHGKTALLVAPSDVDAWVAAMTDLAASAHLRDTIASNAETKFLDAHTWAQRAQLILNHLSDEPVEAHASRPPERKC
jgi:glycosyltransferase involved in cell wall biosynthesis